MYSRRCLQTAPMWQTSSCTRPLFASTTWAGKYMYHFHSFIYLHRFHHACYISINVHVYWFSTHLSRSLNTSHADCTHFDLICTQHHVFFDDSCRLLMATEIRSTRTYWHVQDPGTPNVRRVYPGMSALYASMVIFGFVILFFCRARWIYSIAIGNCCGIR